MKTSDKSTYWTRPVRSATLLCGLLALAFGILRFTSCKEQANTSAPPRLTVGWQTAWATCGQLVETLVHTDITQLYGSNATFRDFLFGPDMLEAALGGNLDATTTGVVPTINLLAANDDWVVVCRLIDFSVSTIARSGTGIATLADLTGRKVGVPFGSGAHPYIVQRLRDNNLRVGTGPDAVDLINVSPAESMLVLQQGGVDALCTWEPNATIIESKGLGLSIDDKRYIGLMAVRKSLVEKNPELVVALLKSLIEANWYVASNRDQTDAWFATRSSFDRELLKKIRIIEPNLKAKHIADIAIQITPEDIALSQLVADQMYASGLIKRPVTIRDHTNLSLAKQATAEVLKSGSKAGSIRLSEAKVGHR